MIQSLDRIAYDVYIAGTLQRFPYKSFGEALNLVMTSLMRELLREKKGKTTHYFLLILNLANIVIFPIFQPTFLHNFVLDLPTSLVKDIQEFTKQLFQNGQNDLQSREYEDNEKEEKENEPDTFLINRFKLNVQTSAVCVDILVWATKDEQGK